jgi:hypothetical protein
MRQNLKSTREFIKSNKVRSTYHSPPSEAQTDPLGRTDLCSMKPKKGGVSLTVEAWREGPTDGDDEVLYHVGEPGLGLDTLMSHL